MKSFFLVILIISNFIFIFIQFKKKIKNIFYKKKIIETDVNEIHNIFKTIKIDEITQAPKKEAIIKSFSISAENKIVGMTSDYEAWIIGCISKVSKNIFEFGTCSGKTTYIMALNSSINSKIITLTLGPKEAEDLRIDNADNKVSYRNIINESIYKNFLFSGTEQENKIEVIFKNSLKFDEKIYEKTFDLIFIDGGHTYSIVKNDSEKAFKMIRKNGIILWHDYNVGKTSSKDVVKYINQVSENRKIKKIKNTSLCFYKEQG